MRPWNARPMAEGTTALVEPAAARSGAYEGAERLGLVWHKATDKRIPEAVHRLREADLELFLGRLWSGDGFIANASNIVPFYATSSEYLASGVQRLLLRLGIVSGVHRKLFKYRGQERPGWTVHLVGDGAIETFVRPVVPHVVGREVAVTRLRA